MTNVKKPVKFHTVESVKDNPEVVIKTLLWNNPDAVIRNGVRLEQTLEFMREQLSKVNRQLYYLKKNPKDIKNDTQVPKLKERQKSLREGVQEVEQKCLDIWEQTRGDN